MPSGAGDCAASCEEGTWLGRVEESHLSAPVAQLDRASGYEPEGRVFESLRAHHDFKCFIGLH